MKRIAVFLLMGALYALHTDVWGWHDPTLVLGLPVGLTYHVAFCLAVAAVMGLAIRWAWPRDLDVDLDGDSEVSGRRPHGGARGRSR